MTNNLRADATDLSPAALKKDVIKLIRFKPECIIAYSASLLALVRTCKEYKQKCHNLKIKGIICTAGPLTKDERDEIGAFLMLRLVWNMVRWKLELWHIKLQLLMEDIRFLLGHI
jgi:phenylacetate-coenzyme A ligase PaaK-like adenylate-forming protein